MWCICQIVLESRFKIHSVQAVRDSENRSGIYVLYRGMFISVIVLGSISCEGKCIEIYTQYTDITVNVDKFHSILTVMQKFQT